VPEQPLEELPADHRGELDGALAVVAQAVQAGHDDALDRVGDAGVIEPAHQPVPAVLPAQHADVEERLRDLLHVERHSLRLGGERLAQLGREVGAAEYAARHGEGSSSESACSVSVEQKLRLPNGGA
jgi:hypothetical protein